jgi:hypothetical protein
MRIWRWIELGLGMEIDFPAPTLDGAVHPKS